jgi:mannose-1-phosphate guanylyltransferase/phosphomannomutase
VKAVIMAGGEGTRLRPLTSSQPKPMVPVANRPLMEHVVGLLRHHGFDDIVVTVAYRAEAIRSYFGDGGDLGVHLTWATETSALGTAGSVRNAMAALDEPFLVISGDIVADVDLGAVVDFHHARAATVTVALQRRADPLDFGMVIVGDDGAVERFVEKPTRGQVLGETVNTGIYVIGPEVFDVIAPDRPVDFAGEVFPHLLDTGRAVYGCPVGGYWEDVGTLGAYLRVHRDVLAGRVRVDIPGFALADGIWLGEGADVDPTAEIVGPAVIGPYCRVEAGAFLGADTVLGANVRVGPDVSVERSVVHDNVYLGPGVRLRGSVVGRSATVRRGARLEDGSVLGADCFVGEHAVINPGVAVYPAKTVDPGAVVDTSIIWESRGARSLFGRHGVTGLANVDITPETAVRLAMAFATTMPRGSTVVVPRHTSRVGRVLKRAVIAGLNAAGVDVVDLEVATVPVTRFAVRHEGSAGGVTVRLVHGDAQAVAIRLVGADGVDIDDSAQKRVQRIYERRDARRALAGEIGDAVDPGRVAEEYTAAVIHLVDVAAVAAARPKVVLDYAYGASSFVMPHVLAKLGADVLSVNPYASTRQALGFDRLEHAAEVARLVTAAGAELGAVIDADGERITFVDDSGHILSDDEGLLVVLRLVLDHNGSVPEPVVGVALPVSVSRAAEVACGHAGAELTLTGLSEAALLEAASAPGVVFAASPTGAYVFPAFLAAYDAVAALVSVLGLLVASPHRLSDLVGAVPPTAVHRIRVRVPYERTGAVMRALLGDDHDGEVVLVDGIKVQGPEWWVLVAPDPATPAVEVIAQAATAADAAGRAERYATRVRRALARAGGPSPEGVDSGMFSA